MKKYKRFGTSLLVAAMAFALVACGDKNGNEENQGSSSGNKTENEQQSETDKKVLRVGLEGTYAPYNYHDVNGELVGYEVDVARAIGEKIGYDVEFVETEWDSMFEALAAGNFDVVMNQVTITPDRLEKYDFSTPYIYSKPILIVASDNEDIKAFEDLAGKRAAEGLTSNFNQIAQDYGAQIVGQDEFSLQMECIISGEADCSITDELTYGYWLTVKGDNTSTKVVAESDDVNSSAILMEKGNDELRGKLDAAIGELLEDGTISELSQKYFSMDISKE